MSSPTPTRRAVLSRQEILFLGLTMAFWAAYVVVLGKDTSWDFRNYHWYAPYAFLNGRMGMDVAVAHAASYYNPFVDIPFYLLATHTTSWIALATLGAVQGANVVPLYLMAREGLLAGERKLMAGGLAVMGLFGALTLTEFGTTYYDNVLSVFVFGGLAILIVNRDTLRTGALRNAGLIAAVAGLITGMAMGLKLPEAPFCVGFAAALVALGGSWKHQLTRLIAGGIAGVLGFALFSVPWMLHVYDLTGNPLFPYFNDYWQSPLVLAAPYRDLRFVPHEFWRELFFPILFSIDWHIADDLGFQDFRVCAAYILVIVAMAIFAARRHSRDPLVRADVWMPLFAFTGVSYFVWLKMFAIYRYIVGMEMIAPLVIVAAVGLLPLSRRARYLGLAALAFALTVTARSDFMDRAPLGDPYVQAAIPPIARPDRTMVVLTGDSPMGYLATTLPAQIPVLRIDGFMLQPRDGTRMTASLKARVAAHLAGGGDLFLIAEVNEMLRAGKALSDYGLAAVMPQCQQFDTSVNALYQWCPLSRKP